MELFKKAVIVFYLAVLLFDLLMFAFTRDAYHGIWVVILILAARVSVSIEPKRKVGE